MAIIPVTQLMAQAQQGVNMRMDEERTQEKFTRERAAYNALRHTYGDIAGDPVSALQMQSYGFNEEMNPLKIQHQSLTNEGLSDQNNYLRQDYPLRIEQRQLGNRGLELGNEGEVIDNQQAGRDLRADETDDMRKALFEGASHVKQRIEAGVDPGAAYDEVAPYLPLTPEQSQQIRDTLVANPAELDSFLQQIGSGGESKGGLTPVFGYDAAGNWVPHQVTENGQLRPLSAGPGVTFTPKMRTVNLGDREAVMSPDGRILSIYPKGGAPSADQSVVFDEQGNPTGLAPTPGGKLDVEQQAEAAEKVDGQTKLTENLEGLAQTYLKLDELGAAVNPDRGVVGNTIARLRSTSVGQIAESAAGTEAQSLRERINNMRPLLVQHIRQATDMSARGMDSNRELEFYLQAATDPTKDLYSNLAAIQVLDETFGLGGILERVLPGDVYERVAGQAQLDQQNMPIVITPDQIDATGGDDGFGNMTSEELDAILRGE